VTLLVRSSVVLQSAIWVVFWNDARAGTISALLAGSFFSLLTGCATQPAVDVYLVNIKPLPSTLFEQRAEIDLRFQNLGDQPIRASGVNISLTVNGKKLAQGVSRGNFTIPPLSESTTSVTVSSGLFDTIRQLLAIPERESFSYILKGKIYADGLDRRFRRSGELHKTDLRALAPGQSRHE